MTEKERANIEKSRNDMKQAEKNCKKAPHFRKPEFADYMEDLLEEKAWLVINPVNDKFSSYKTNASAERLNLSNKLPRKPISE